MLLSEETEKGILSGLYAEWMCGVERERLLGVTERLWRAELGQTFENYHVSARLAEGLLKEAGCSGVERITFPADGRTVYQDKTTPIGWRARVGKLEVVKSALSFDPAVIADFQEHPFHLVKGSVSTPEEGMEVRLITQEALENGEDAQGAFILFHPEQRPTCRILENTGALGFVSDFLVGRYETPWAHSWVNGCSDSYAWHTGAGDRPFIGFSISPQTGDRLREALRQGEVRVRVTSDGERYEDTIDVVTGVIPGVDSREIWLLAHLYEPLANDNSAGVACALEIARGLQAMIAEKRFPMPQFTVRLVFAMEVYGFAAYAEHRGGYLRDQVLCAMNLDALPILPGDKEVTLGLSQSGSPSAADAVLETLFTAGLPQPHVMTATESEGLYADDRQLGDASIGIPVLWVTRSKRILASAPGQGATSPANPVSCGTPQPLYLWHNSEQTMACICPELFHHVTVLYGTWLTLMLASEFSGNFYWVKKTAAIAHSRLEATRERILQGNGLPVWLRYRLEIETRRLQDHLRFGADAETVQNEIDGLTADVDRFFEKLPDSSPGEIDSVWAKAESLILHRNCRGLLRNIAAASVGKRDILLSHAGVLLMVHADGQRTVAELLRRAEWETATIFLPEGIQNLLDTLHKLAEYDYLRLEPLRVRQKEGILT